MVARGRLAPSRPRLAEVLNERGNLFDLHVFNKKH